IVQEWEKLRGGEEDPDEQGEAGRHAGAAHWGLLDRRERERREARHGDPDWLPRRDDEAEEEARDYSPGPPSADKATPQSPERQGDEGDSLEVVEELAEGLDRSVERECRGADEARCL